MVECKKKFGALKVFLEKKLAEKLVSSSEFEYISVKISSYDIKTSKESKYNLIPVSEELFSKGILIENIPVGIDRIVSVQAYCKKKNKCRDFLIRGVCDIVQGENSVELAESTMAFASVLYGIKDIFNFEELENDGRMNVVRNVIDTAVHPSLFDSAKLIGELQGFSFPWNAHKSDYILQTGNVNFIYREADAFSVSVNDPLSQPFSNQNASHEIKISGIAPGNWDLLIFSPDGTVIEQYELRVKSGEEINLGELYHNGVTVLDENGKNRYANEKYLETLSITEENFKKCFIDDAENRRFVLLVEPSYFDEEIFSVKACFNSGINDCEGLYNGEIYDFSRSEKGFWFVFVPYRELQQTNQSGQPSYNLKINGKMIEPPAFVPDGYIYQKFFGSIGTQRFLVLIYGFQDEKEICARLSNAKKCKKLDDFDLNSEAGQKQIANFRLVPGTKNLFRSYHPYQDDKVKISNTSKARMKYVEKLSEAAGIQADINLSDLKQANCTYSMPSYYQKIIDSDKVLYMTDCTYSVCYERTSSDEFKNGIEKIADFVNSIDGPYQIHCAIGTDRTGIVCAVISGLCGASLSEIENDYCSSIEMGIYEYRGPGAVRYSLQNLLGVTFIEEVENLQESLIRALSKNDKIMREKINKMIDRLKK